METYEIRPLLPGDELPLLECHRAVFSQEGRRPRTLDEWRWAFERNPAGQRVFVALHRGSVVAQYAALPERVWIGGEERIFAQIVDSMVHPDHRAGLKRPGLFVRTAQAFFDAYGGPDRDLVHYGWPISGARRIGERFLEYETVRTQCVLVREPGAGSATAPSGVEELTRLDQQAKWLWDRCADGFGASAIRDERFLNWRFCDHPRERYTLLAARDSAGILRGLAVYRAGDWILTMPGGLGLVCDWLVPPEELEVGELLLESLLARARRDRVLALVALFPEWSPWFLAFQERGFLVHPTDYATTARNFHPRYDMRWLREHWWYQLADSDLA